MKFVDLFAGGGGLSEGFIQEGYEPVAHVEADVAACNTLRTRLAYHWFVAAGRRDLYEDYLTGGIDRDKMYAEVPQRVVRSVINDEIQPDTLARIYCEIDSLLEGRKLDLLLGGPPCQAYSIVGRSRDPDGMVEDKRNYLYECYASFLDKYRPKRFVFENVMGLLSARDSNGRLYFDAMRQRFSDLGYETAFSTLNAKDYGVLQNRKRVILVGHCGDAATMNPEPERWTPRVTVSEIFQDLPPLSAGEGDITPCRRLACESRWQVKAGVGSPLPATWHQARPHTARDLEIYRIAVTEWNERQSRLRYGDLPRRLKTHSNETAFVDRFKVVAADLPFAHTVVAHICKDGHYYIHPDIDQNRSITPREAARLQTFPDDYYFEGVRKRPSRTHAFRQIGNAVPVLLSRGIASRIRHNWDG
ncbi:MAG: DNA cytosine methyltransferase [Bryobacterales bacterium]|nr:DNA cytosine methyltransferase [Bryobacterales bacterium]MDE0629376.1 DNA cytosine methyltransferase [Bryobacterales bacterium]